MEKSWGYGHIQIGSDKCNSIKNIAETKVKIYGKNIDVLYDVSKPDRDKAISADYSKAMEILGWEPKVDLEEGLREQYEWIKFELEKTN